MRYKSFVYTLCMATATLLLNGCATSYYVQTNAYLDRSFQNSQLPAGAAFTVLSNQNAPNPIFDNEVKTKIETLLLSKGYRLASEGQSQYFITFNYDVSGKTKTETRPDFVTRPELTHRVYVSGSNTYYDLISPGYSYVTYISETFTVYNARVFVKVLDAASLKKNDQERVAWVGDTINESQNPDLRESIDYLLVATFKFFGQDTGKNKEVVLSQDDKEVARLRNAVHAALDPAKAG